MWEVEVTWRMAREALRGPRHQAGRRRTRRGGFAVLQRRVFVSAAVNDNEWAL